MSNYAQRVRIKAAEHRRLLAELNEMGESVNRCQDTITSLLAELNTVNAKFQGQRTTQQEVDYLTVLLACAKRKLSWEKQIASLQKRSPTLLAEMTRILEDKDFPPTAELKAEMMRSLQAVQNALECLQTSTGALPDGG